MKRAHFAGWARPYEFNAQLYSRLQRTEEARDSARVALHMPWWTLRSGFEAAARLAQLPADAAAVHRQLSEATKANKGGPLPAGIGVVSMTDEQVRVPISNPAKSQCLLLAAVAAALAWTVSEASAGRGEYHAGSFLRKSVRDSLKALEDPQESF